MSENPFSSLFDDPESWQIFASGQAEGRLSQVIGADGGKGLKFDYDFHGGGGFVVIRRVIRFTLPETFEIGFKLRGEGPPNHFEFKVADPGGANVWRNLRQDFQLPSSWTDYRFHERDLPFAWGPAGGGAPSVVEAVEIVIAAGPGGKGMLELTAPSIEDQTLRAPAGILASSHQDGCPPVAVFAAKSGSVWRANPDDANPWWEVDFGRRLRFGGMIIHWPDGLPPRSCGVAVSDDGRSWTSVYQAQAAAGALTHIPVPQADARHLRITFGNAEYAALASLVLRPDAFTRTPNEFIHNVAADFPRGWFPRYWLREQSYWTPVGSPEGKRRALINEEGLLEVDEAGFSLEPFLLTPQGPVTWADVKPTLHMPRGGAPMPSVTWRGKGFTLDILPWVGGKGDSLTLHVTYRLKYASAAPGTRLMVSARPWQVNPPWQAFRNLGGRSSIHHITCHADGLTVEGRRIILSPAADSSGAALFEEGGVLMALENRGIPARSSAEDPSGLASAVMIWNLEPGRAIHEVTVSMPYFGTFDPPAAKGRTQALARWRRKLGAVKWNVPRCAAHAFDCLRTTAGHILINRDGPAIQPGPRRYTRSWVRDCVIMGAALAKAGIPGPLREFLEWYAPFQREDGFIPCVVDRDGVDWLVEHDSHGQFLWGLREVMRESGDKRFLKRMMPHARLAADFLINLRNQRLTEEFKTTTHSASFGLLPESLSMEDESMRHGRSAFYGLLPESASHEGYLAHPVHSYWDDFWGVRGLQAAAYLADLSGFHGDAERWRNEASYFQDDLLWSIRKVVAEKQLNYIPGSVEWADFDPTATSNAIAQLDFAGVLPEEPLHSMLETYLDGHRRKHRGEMPWNNYTAYEIRIIGAFVRIGKRDIANELLEFHLGDRRPREWNQWPEITWHDPRSPGHLGDVPHTWIAAEYLLAVSSMVASEREADSSMVLACGMPWQWISAEKPFSVRNLPTRYGTLDFHIHARGTESIEVHVGGNLSLPPGGLTLDPPLPPGFHIDHDGSHTKVHTLPLRRTLKLCPRPSEQI